MKGYRVRTGDGAGYYGFEDDYSDAKSLLSQCLQHDPKATIEPYEYESQSEKIYRLEQENAVLKQEQAGRKKGCEYCDFSSGDVGGTLPGPNTFQLIQSDGDVYIVSDGYGYFRSVKIECCPMCGRRLK